MKVHLFTYLVAALVQTQAFVYRVEAYESASAETQAAVPCANEISKESGIPYASLGIARALVDDPTKFDRNKAVLALDKNGKPAVYPLFDGRYACSSLSQHTIGELVKHWGPAKVKNEVYSFSFMQWVDGWKPVQLELQFGENRCCNLFRVVSDETKFQSWLPAKFIPSDMNRRTKPLRISIEIGLVEGPRDVTDCGIHPISDVARRAIEQERCPYRTDL